MSQLRDEAFIKKFGNHLREIRKRKGLFMREVANNSGMGLNSLYRIEKGRVDISISTLAAIAKALDIHPTKLLTF